MGCQTLKKFCHLRETGYPGSRFIMRNSLDDLYSSISSRCKEEGEEKNRLHGIFLDIRETRTPVLSGPFQKGRNYGLYYVKQETKGLPKNPKERDSAGNALIIGSQ